jgi:colanic acid biosynthesis glycosyl transferase WcaI
LEADRRAYDPSTSDAGARPDLHGRRVLVYSIYFAPEATGIAPYTTRLAEHLAERGAEVEVVTGFPHYPAWRLHPGYERGLRRRERVGAVTVTRARQRTPRRHNGATRILYEVTWLLNGITLRPRPADLVIGVTPNLAGAALAWRAAVRSAAPLGLIVQDLTGPAAAQSGITGGALIPTVTRRLEGVLLRAADRVAVVSDGFVPYLRDVGVSADVVHEVRNWARTAPVDTGRDEARRRVGFPLDRPVALHAGNMGAKQALEVLVDAARLAPDLDVVLMGDGNQRRRLEAAAAGLTNLRMLPLQADDEVPYVLAAADVLLVNERASVRDMALPSKLTAYFTSGRPVVAAVRPDGVTAREVGRAGGVVVAPEDPAAVVEAVRRLLAGPDLAARLVSSARTHAAAVLSERAGLESVDRFVDDLLAAPLAERVGSG